MTIKLDKTKRLTVDRFIDILNGDPTVQIDPASDNPFLYLRYSRNEIIDGHETGVKLWGFIYRSARGRFSLVGEAESDWLAFEV